MKIAKQKAVITSGILLALTLASGAYLVSTRSYNHAAAQTSQIIQESTTTSDGLPTKMDMFTTDKDILEETDAFLPTYEEFLTDLQKTCPYYEPNGVEYRDCIAGLLSKSEKTVTDYSNELAKDEQIIIDEYKAEGRITTLPEESFLASLRDLQRTWKPYRDALCLTELSVSIEGTNYSGMTNTCKLHETMLYYGRLQDFWHVWIDEPVQVQYKATGAPIKTKAFEALTHRAGITND